MSVVGHDPGITLCVGLWYGEEGDEDVDRKLLNSCKPSIRTRKMPTGCRQKPCLPIKATAFKVDVYRTVSLFCFM